MKHRSVLVTVAILSLMVCAACSNFPGVHRPESAVVTPSDVVDFNTLYGQNCAGCHGVDGNGRSRHCPGESGVSRDCRRHRDSPHRRKRSARHADAGFCSECGRNAHRQTDRRSSAGDPIVGETRRSRRSESATLYSAGSRRSAARRRCLSDLLFLLSWSRRPRRKQGQFDCDGSYLALVSDQQLRTIVIAGRPELGAPDWRGDVEGRPMSAQDISDVVAWLSSQRPKFPGQPYPISSMNPAQRGSR